MNLSQWYQLPKQKFLKEALIQHISQWLDRKDTEITVQIDGGKLNNKALYHINSKKIIILSQDREAQPNIVCDTDRLPLLSKSIDMVIVMHTFETTSNPHQFIRELNRIVRDDGQIMVIGFNRTGFLGLGYLLHFFRKSFSSVLRLMSVKQLDDWFSLLSFSKKDQVFIFHNKKLQLLVNNLFFDKLCKSKYYFFGVGDLYCCLYQKQVIPLTFDLSILKEKQNKPTLGLLETKNYE